tara:strand:- start:614 stop:1849 length:1236 start_codon:yes stop_codon:yes gene_type:complete
MFSYSKIKNPETNRLVNIHSKKGKEIIKNYVLYHSGGHDGPCALGPPNADGHTRCIKADDSDGKCELGDSGRCRKKSLPKSAASKTSSANIKKLPNGKTVYTKILTKAYNKKREDARLDFIVDSLNNPTSVFGARLKTEYNRGKHRNDHIASASNEGLGGCGKHYDLEITTVGGDILNCEEKSTDRARATLNKKKPWAIAVQALNVILRNSQMFKKYAKQYYTFITWLAGEYDLPPPDYPQFEKEFFKTGGVTNPRMMAIKNTFVGRHGASIQKIYADRIHDVNQKFLAEVTSLDKKTFIAFVQQKLTESFNQKHCWLQTAGLTLDYNKYMATGDFNFTKSAPASRFMWSDHIPAPVITDISLDAVANDGEAAQLYITYQKTTIDNPVAHWGDRTYVRLRNRFANCSTDYK